MEEPTCAVCGSGVAQESDHVQAEIRVKQTSDVDHVDNYYLHSRCARDEISEWELPA